MRKYLLTAFLVLPSVLQADPILGHIKIDNFGYRPGDPKIAYFTADPGPRVVIRSAATNSVALAVTTIVDKGQDSSSPLISGDHVWWVDFSALGLPGTYYVYSPALKEQSYNFEVSLLRYRAPMEAALKALYYTRCGTSKTPKNGGVWNDDACHEGDSALEPLCPAGNHYGAMEYGTLDLSGGWHDAGDYEKKIGYSVNGGVTATGDNGDTLWYLLTAYELHPSLFPDGQSHIPESGNGLPDILDEAKWELDWYLKMQRPDGHVLAGVHVTDLGGLKSPPSADRVPRFYMPPCYESEAVFTACAAHAARVFASLPAGAAYAAKLKKAALLTWDTWVKKSPDKDPMDLPWTSYKGLKLWAASEIFRLDPKQANAKAYIDGYADWGAYTMNTNGLYSNWAIYNYLLTPGGTSAVVMGMKTSLKNLADHIFSQDDIYHSGMDSWTYSENCNWFKAETGMTLYWAARLGASGSHTPAECFYHAEDFLHYLHGANPLNMLYMSNTESMGGKHCVWHLFNTWFSSFNNPAGGSNFVGKPSNVVDPLYPYVAADNESSSYGPPPGYVPGGPTYQYLQLGGMSVPPNLPGKAEAPYAKAYRDFCNGSQPWLVNESGIYETSSYLALASLFASLPTASPAPKSVKP